MFRYFDIMLSVFTLFFILVIKTNMVHSDDKVITPTTFLLEAPHAWKKLKAEYQKGVNVTLTYSSDLEPLTTIRVCFDKKQELNHWQFSGKDLGESLRVINGDYAFYIRKKDKSSNWILKDFIDDVETARKASINIHQLLPATINIYEGIMLHEGWLEDLVISKEFSIASIDKTREGTQEHVELIFHSQYEPYENCRILGGRISFDPKQFWLVQKYEIDIESLSDNTSKDKFLKETATFEYQNINDIPFLKKSRYADVVNKSEKFVLNKEYTSITRDILPQKEFYMSHYGFPEPSTPMRRGDVIRIILMVAGTILILVSLFMRFLAKRMK
jgi:hypothetical protein